MTDDKGSRHDLRVEVRLLQKLRFLVLVCAGIFVLLVFYLAAFQ